MVVLALHHLFLALLPHILVAVVVDVFTHHSQLVLEELVEVVMVAKIVLLELLELLILAVVAVAQDM